MTGEAPYIALTRGINVGGHNQVAMADLRILLERLGLGDVRTLHQSGNLVFRSPPRPTGTLEKLLEHEVERQLGLRTEFFVRTARELASVIAGNPFPAEAGRDPAHLLVMFLKNAPGAGAVNALRSAIVGSEACRARGRELYITYPDGIGRSRLTSTVIERRLATRATGRNWNTVLKLGALAEG